MKRAVNPTTGEVLFLVGNSWMPPSQRAKNEAGETAYLVNNEWIMPEAKEGGRTLGSAVGDISTALKKGVVGAAQSGIGLLDIPTGGKAGKYLEEQGIDLAKTQEELSRAYSPEQQEAIRKLGEAEGFAKTIEAGMENPSAVASTIGESLPEWAAMGLVGKAAKMAKLAKTTAGAAAVGEGLVTAGSLAEQTRAQAPEGELTSKQTLGAIGGGAVTVLIGNIAGRLTQTLGGITPEMAMVGGLRKAAGRELGEAASTPGAFQRIMASAFGEGVLEEMPQSAQERLWYNYANDRPLMEGVSEDAAIGLMAGSVAGGAIGGLHQPVSEVPETQLGTSITEAQPNASETIPGEAAVTPGMVAPITESVSSEAIPEPQGVPVPEGGGPITREAAEANVKRNEAIRQEIDRSARWGLPDNSRAHAMLLSGNLHTPEGLQTLEKELTETKVGYRKDEALKDINESRQKLSMPPLEAITQKQVEAKKPSLSPEVKHAADTVIKLREVMAKPEFSGFTKVPVALRNAAKKMGVYNTEHAPEQMLDAVEEKVKRVQDTGIRPETLDALDKTYSSKGTALDAIRNVKHPELSAKTHRAVKTPDGAWRIEPKEQSAQPTTAVSPEQPAQPTTAVPPEQPAQPTTAVPPEQPAQPTTAVPPEQPAQPTTAVPPEQPAQPTTAVPPGQPAQPTTAVSPGQPAQPTTAVPPGPSIIDRVLAEQPGKRLQEATRPKKSLGERISRAMTYIETMLFQTDAALQNKLRSQLNALKLPYDMIKDIMLASSTSQAVRDTSLAAQALIHGGLIYNPETFKFESVHLEGQNLDAVRGALIKIAQQYGNTEDQTKHLFNTLMKARRILGMYEAADRVLAEAQALPKADQRAYLKSKEDILNLPGAMNMTREEAQAGVSILQERHEFQEPISIWEKVRENVLQTLVDSGRFSREQAENYLNVAEYVPFYRVMKTEKEHEVENIYTAMSRGTAGGVIKGMKLYKIKGHTEREVDDILSNMEQWIVNSFTMAIRAHKGRTLVDTVLDWMPEGTVEKVTTGTGAVPIYRNGVKEFYKFEDPLLPFAFTGLTSITTPALTAVGKFSNVLRQSVILNPIFTILQLPQDTFEAIFTSGLKRPFMLIPEVMKEFLTMLVRPTAAHKILRSTGTVGVHDFTASSARAEADIYLGLSRKKPRNAWGKLIHGLETFSMIGDNAVRQAVYNRTMKETGDKALAIERASEIINFRRRGASAISDMIRQVVPFYGAYLQVQNVAFKTLAGKGIAPSEKAKAYRTLISTVAQVYALGLIYNMMLADDKDYQDKDWSVKNRHLFLFGGDGPAIPIRASIFAMPFVMSNVGFDNLVDNGTNDPAEARKAVWEAFRQALLEGPPMGPTVLKTPLEIALNHNFLTGREIVGKGLGVEPEEQYTTTTSEFGKMMGRAGVGSPIMWDYLVRGMLGYAGAGFLTLSNVAASEAFGVPLPAKTAKEWLREVPGMGTLIPKETSSKGINNYYDVQNDVDTAVRSYKLKEKRAVSPKGEKELERYAEKNQYLLDPGLRRELNKMQEDLAKIREETNMIYQLPYTEMSAEEKQANIKELEQARIDTVSDIKDLRRAAQGLE